MMGHNTRSESLFAYFRPEGRIPEDHPSRLIDFAFVRETEVLLRVLLIVYLCGSKN